MTEIALSNNRIFRLEQDEDPCDPRGDDNLGKMICFHKGYNLGDKHDLSSDMFDGWEEMEKYLKETMNAGVILPLYLYDHSGITMNTTGFSCRWDSGQVGFIYCTLKDVLENWPGQKSWDDEMKDWREEDKMITTREATERLLKGEVETYDQYLTGEIYRFSITKVETCDHGHKHETKEDSCSGFYGSDLETNGVLEHVSDEDRKEILEQI